MITFWTNKGTQLHLSHSFCNPLCKSCCMNVKLRKEMMPALCAYIYFFSSKGPVRHCLFMFYTLFMLLNPSEWITGTRISQQGGGLLQSIPRKSGLNKYFHSSETQTSHFQRGDRANFLGTTKPREHNCCFLSWHRFSFCVQNSVLCITLFFQDEKYRSNVQVFSPNRIFLSGFSSSFHGLVNLRMLYYFFLLNIILYIIKAFLDFLWTCDTTPKGLIWLDRYQLQTKTQACYWWNKIKPWNDFSKLTMGEFEICWRLGAFYPTGCTFIIYIYAFTFTKIFSQFTPILCDKKRTKTSPGSSQWNRCRQFCQLWWGTSYFIITVFWSKL